MFCIELGRTAARHSLSAEEDRVPEKKVVKRRSKGEKKKK